MNNTNPIYYIQEALGVNSATGETLKNLILNNTKKAATHKGRFTKLQTKLWKILDKNKKKLEIAQKNGQQQEVDRIQSIINNLEKRRRFVKDLKHGETTKGVSEKTKLIKSSLRDGSLRPQNLPEGAKRIIYTTRSGKGNDAIVYVTKDGSVYDYTGTLVPVRYHKNGSLVNITSMDGKNLTINPHRIYAQAFGTIQYTPDRKYIAHAIDGNRQNISPDNLQIMGRNQLQTLAGQRLGGDNVLNIIRSKLLEKDIDPNPQMINRIYERLRRGESLEIALKDVQSRRFKPYLGFKSLKDYCEFLSQKTGGRVSPRAIIQRIQRGITDEKELIAYHRAGSKRLDPQIVQKAQEIGSKYNVDPKFVYKRLMQGFTEISDLISVSTNHGVNFKKPIEVTLPQGLGTVRSISSLAKILGVNSAPLWAKYKRNPNDFLTPEQIDFLRNSIR